MEKKMAFRTELYCDDGFDSFKTMDVDSKELNGPKGVLLFEWEKTFSFYIRQIKVYIRNAGYI